MHVTSDMPPGIRIIEIGPEDELARPSISVTGCRERDRRRTVGESGLVLVPVTKQTTVSNRSADYCVFALCACSALIK